MDVGNKCVSCGRDTSFGTGLFVNRIPADAEYESEYGGKIVFKEGQYRDGYLCPECSALSSYRVHYKCLNKEERKVLDNL